jgi:hypothetical protein
MLSESAVLVNYQDGPSDATRVRLDSYGVHIEHSKGGDFRPQAVLDLDAAITAARALIEMVEREEGRGCALFVFGRDIDECENEYQRRGWLLSKQSWDSALDEAANKPGYGEPDDWTNEPAWRPAALTDVDFGF